MSRAYDPNATYKTICGHVLSNVQLTRTTKPNLLETAAANLVEMLGFGQVGSYKVSNIIGTGDHVDADGKRLWSHEIKGAKGFQKVAKP